MRETPPYSLVEIRLLLARYLDGTLEMEQMLHLDDLMEHYPVYREEFLKLQAAQYRVQDALQTPTDANEDESNETWLRIAEQLEVDRGKPLSPISPEWVSAYVDGEISRQDAERDIFESQLAHDPENARLLAEFQEISETIRQFGYRLESNCTVDIAEQVMAQFQSEQTRSEPSVESDIELLETQPMDAEWELLSAFSDQSLTPREIIQATQLIESSEAARMRLATLNGLSAGIQRVSECLQSQAPADVWPMIHAEVQASLAPVEPRFRKLQWLKQAAIPIAATVLLALLSLPSLHLNSLNPLMTETAPSPQSLHFSPEPQQMATAQPVNTEELASVPGHSSVRLVDYQRSDLSGQDTMTGTDAGTMGTLPASDSNATVLKPMLERTEPVIAAGVPHAVIPANAASSHTAPTSDAYLFDALSKKVPEEEISNIIGK